ncbi:MAG: NCS2 family permease, partial [bacterium]|nr:NCS2 family permease [bacterium]
VGKALLVDAISTTISGLTGTSSGTTYVESASGVSVGGRTGLTAIVVGLLFLPFLFVSNLAAAIPGYATAPALIVVGVFMLSGIKGINFDDFEEGFPAFLGLILIPLTYSITQGIIWAFLSYTLIKMLRRKFNEIHWMMYIICGFSILGLILMY